MTHRPSPEQADIVEYPFDLPLRVTAGAGTGKTTTLARRLGAAVAGGHVPVEQALGITFTNKAAGELAAAIRAQLTGVVEAGHEVEVTTYHGFAYSLVREFGPIVGIPRDVRVVTPGYVRQLLRDELGRSPRVHLDLTKPGTEVDRLLRLSSRLGDHLLTPEDLHGAGIEELAPVRSEMGAVVEAFQERKRAIGVVDYADLVAAAHRIVMQHPEIGERVTNRYRLVLLDEYQDTNPAQRELFVTLFGSGFPVTAVGDSDQTIYEWRGASPENFDGFPEHFPNPDGSPAQTRSLSVSWRSGPEIVAVANWVRDQIVRRGPLPRLRAQPAAPASRIRTHWLRTSIDESRWIAADVTHQHAEGRAWSEMAVLFRKHREMGVIRDAMVDAGIPVEVASLGGLLDVPEVADLHAWLRVLGRPDDAPALARILLGSRFRLGLADLRPLAEWVRVHRRAPDEASIGWALLEAVDAVEEVRGLSTEAAGRLIRFRGEYRGLLADAQGVSLVELCRRVLDTTDAWTEIEALPDAARLTARLNVYRFLDLAEDWSPLDRRPSLEAFLEHLDTLSEESAAEELDTAVISGEDAVTLVTVHRAKGLEWPVVYLPALAADTFPMRALQLADPFRFPEFLPHDLRLDRSSLPVLEDDDQQRRDALRAHHDDAEWRTAYVAVTRAAEELVGTGAWWYTTGRPKDRSPLFELIARGGIPEPRASEDPGDAPNSLRLDLDTPGPDPHFPDGVLAAMRSSITDPEHARSVAAEAGIADQYDAAMEQLEIRLAGLPGPPDPDVAEDPFRTSVTGLVSYEGCGLRFRWEHIDRLPRRPSEAARRGSQLHRRIETHHRGTLAFDEADEEFRADAEGTAPRVESAFARFLGSRYGQERPVLVEAPFELSVNDAVVSGRIDAVYGGEDTWEVVDFKSGSPSSDPSRRVQLEAYAIAATDVELEGQHRPDRLQVSFVHLGGDGLVVESEEVDDSWLHEARNHLSSLVAGAEHGPHDAEPGEHCRRCDFTRFCEPGTEWLEAAT